MFLFIYHNVSWIWCEWFEATLIICFALITEFNCILNAYKHCLFCTESRVELLHFMWMASSVNKAFNVINESSLSCWCLQMFAIYGLTRLTRSLTAQQQKHCSSHVKIHCDAVKSRFYFFHGIKFMRIAKCCAEIKREMNFYAIHFTFFAIDRSTLTRQVVFRAHCSM